jgi:hypothetical protein
MSLCVPTGGTERIGFSRLAAGGDGAPLLPRHLTGKNFIYSSREETAPKQNNECSASTAVRHDFVPRWAKTTERYKTLTGGT